MDKGMYLWHWRSNTSEMFALFEEYKNAEKYADANPAGGDVILSEILSLGVIDHQEGK